MSSIPESLAPGFQLLHYVLNERFPGSINAWKASDSRSGKPVAIKILTRLVPKDKAQRDAMLKEARVGAATRHPGVAQILEIDIDRDMLFMVLELIEGDSLRQRTRVSPPARGEFLRLAFQIADAVAHLHSKGIAHGELNSESFVVTPQGDVHLVGMGYASIRRKHESGPTFLGSLRPNDALTPLFLSPEQVIGKPVDSRSDVFALGTVFYEMLEGKTPFRGATPAEITQAIAQSAPAAPAAPTADRSILSLIGRCLQKIPDKRYQKADEILADLRKLEPNIDRLAARKTVTPVAVAPPPQAAAAPAWIVVCELPYHELLRKKDPEQASRLETRMQQYLGEAVYLFDGKVLDSFGPRMVAELPDASSALRAAQKGLADIVEHNMSNAAEPVEPRTVVHFGELVATTGKPGGVGLEIADAVLDAMEPMQTLVSEPVIRALGLTSIPSPAGAFRGVNFYAAPTLLPRAQAVPTNLAPPAASHDAAPAPVPASRPAPTAHATKGAAHEEIDDASMDDEAIAPSPTKKKSSSMALVAGIGAVVVLGGAAAAFFMMRKGDAAPPVPVAVAVATQAPEPATAEPPPPTDTAPTINPSEVFLGGVVVETSAPPTTTDTTATTTAPPPDPKLVALANGIGAMTASIVRLDSSLTFVDAAAPTSRVLGAVVRKGDDGLVLVPTLVEGSTLTEGDPIALPAKVKDYYEPALALAHWMASTLGKDLATVVSTNAGATKAYIDAVAQQRAGDDKKATASAKKAVAADAKYLRAHELLYAAYLRSGNRDDAFKSAATIASLDPANLEIRKELARWEAERGNAPKAISYLAALLSAKGDDPEVLTLVGDYALAVADEGKFQTVVARLASVRASNPRLHEPDITLARGRVDASVKAYYKTQETQQDNPWLSLKIGRLAVIRRSDSIIELEQARQQRLNDPYTLPMLSAFIAAGKGDAATADAEIAKAESAVTRADDHYTLVAEVNVLLNRQKQVLAALETAVAHSEPSLTYIVSSPLFGYLGTDPRFTKLKRVIREKSAGLSAALQSMSL
ncbi:MAG: protein kinase [Acidobacteria bacterium]|nr:protein kinase [Acidobacteriota bacterium]